MTDVVMCILRKLKRDIKTSGTANGKSFQNTLTIITSVIWKFAFLFQVGYFLLFDSGLGSVHIQVVHSVKWQLREGFVLPGFDWHDELMLQHYCHSLLDATGVSSGGVSTCGVWDIGFLVELLTDGTEGRHTVCCFLQGILCEVGANIHNDFLD